MSIHLNFRKFGLRPTLFSRPVFGDRLKDANASFKRYWVKWRAGDFSWGKWSLGGTRIKVRPERVAEALSILLMLLMVAIGAYWIMRMVQIPSPPSVTGKGIVFYEAGADQALRSLFGEKTFDTTRLVLRGIVITGTNAAGNQGMALIEIDGKTAEAISVGEMLPPGIRLESINPEGVVVNYQGKKISLQQSFDSGSGKSQ